MLAFNRFLFTEIEEIKYFSMIMDMKVGFDFLLGLMLTVLV